MSIVVRVLGITVIVMMAGLAIRLLNERERLSCNLENKPRLDKRSRLIWKMKILGSRRKLKQGRRSLGLMMLTFLVGFLTMRAYANEYFFMIGDGHQRDCFCAAFLCLEKNYAREQTSHS